MASMTTDPLRLQLKATDDFALPKPSPLLLPSTLTIDSAYQPRPCPFTFMAKPEEDEEPEEEEGPGEELDKAAAIARQNQEADRRFADLFEADMCAEGTGLMFLADDDFIAHLAVYTAAKKKDAPRAFNYRFDPFEGYVKIEDPDASSEAGASETANSWNRWIYAGREVPYEPDESEGTGNLDWANSWTRWIESGREYL